MVSKGQYDEITKDDKFSAGKPQWVIDLKERCWAVNPEHRPTIIKVREMIRQSRGHKRSAGSHRPFQQASIIRDQIVIRDQGQPVRVRFESDAPRDSEVYGSKW